MQIMAVRTVAAISGPIKMVSNEQLGSNTVAKVNGRITIILALIFTSMSEYMYLIS